MAAKKSVASLMCAEGDAQFRPVQPWRPTYVELKLADIERLFGRR
jgi:hypothetical protein